MKKNNLILFLSLPLFVFVVTCSLIGILATDFYYQESASWMIQSKGQDMINLFVVGPLLFISSILASKGNRKVFEIWAGINLYLAYTFVIYCFNIHFNDIFLLYCFCLCLSFYSFLYFIHIIKPVVGQSTPVGTRPIIVTISVFFITTTALFYLIWLLDILKALMNNDTPSEITDTGLFTNPVHVLDISILLPGIALIGILLLRKNRKATVFVPAILVFFILMDITIAFLAIHLIRNDQSQNPVMIIFMGILISISLVLLWRFWRNYPIK